MSENQLIEALLTGKPYFGPAMRVTQSPPVRHGYLTALVAVLSQSKRYGRIHILEIGSWAGASAVTWAMAIQRLGRKGKITCVDRWQPYFDEELETAAHYQAMNEAAQDEKVFKLFLHNIRAANVEHMVDYRVGDARTILPKLRRAKYDIVYIDGSHLYESVRADIEDAKRLVRQGGIICGDDLELQRTEVDDVEHRAAVDLKKDFVHSLKADTYYHPGVTEAVAVEFGEVSSWEGVWAIRKVDSQWMKVEVDTLAVQIPSHIRNAAAVLDPAEEVPKREIDPGEQRSALVELVDSTGSFNLIKVRTNGRFLAVAKQLGPTDLFVERLGERELAPLLFSGESLEEVRRKALCYEPESIDFFDPSPRGRLSKAWTIHKTPHGRPAPRLSIIICGQASPEGGGILSALDRQSAPRALFEVIYVECFGGIVRDLLQLADTAASCNQNSFFEHRGAALNIAAGLARGEVLVVLEPTVAPNERFVENILGAFFRLTYEPVDQRTDSTRIALVGGWIDQAAPIPRFIAIPKADFDHIKGFDEHEFFSGDSAPALELLWRLQLSGIPVFDAANPEAELITLPPWWTLPPLADRTLILSSAQLRWPQLCEQSRIEPLFASRQFTAERSVSTDLVPTDTPKISFFRSRYFRNRIKSVKRSLGNLLRRLGFRIDDPDSVPGKFKILMRRVLP